ncbi:MAG: hypothetical protein IJ629_00905 [Clostridia bacterium]|nr:hypothetical protein [Clostridia bacterium]
MILKVSLIGIFFIIIGLFILFGFLIYDIRKGRYKVKDSILSKEAEGKYGVLYPESSIDDLKDEIEKIAELLIAGEESNRYTELLRIKAKEDERIQEIKDAITENVELVKYVNDVLKARIKYKDYENEYTLILSFSTVTGGRVFLNDYFVFKNKIIMADAS